MPALVPPPLALPQRLTLVPGEGLMKDPQPEDHWMNLQEDLGPSPEDLVKGGGVSVDTGLWLTLTTINRQGGGETSSTLSAVIMLTRLVQ